MLHRIVIAFCTVVVLGTTVDAQIRKYSNEFLAIGAGGRGLAMSGAQAASTDDIYSTYYNPAGLVHIDNNFQIGFMHSEYFAGIAKYDYGAVAIPIKNNSRVIGLSLIRFAVDDIPNTLELYEPDGSINYDNIKSFSVGDYAFGFSYAQNLKIKEKKLAIGGNAKVIYRKAGSFANAFGFGIDIGAQYRTKNWRFGFAGKDITTTFNAWSFNFTDREKEILTQTDNEIPDNSLELTAPKLTFGTAYDFKIKDKFRITPELDVDFTTDGKRNVLVTADPISIDANFGLEMSYSEIVYLRGGIGNVQSATDDEGKKTTTFQPNIGLGLNIKDVFHIDYAYTDIGNLSEGLFSHVFSVKVAVNGKTPKPSE